MSLVVEFIVPVDKSIFLTVNKRLKKRPGARYYFLRYLEARKRTHINLFHQWQPSEKRS
jgi:hypothetical protein